MDMNRSLAVLVKDMCVLFRDMQKHLPGQHNQSSHGRGGSSGSSGQEPESTEATLTEARARQLAIDTIDKEGFTYDPVHKNSPTSGFVVSAYPKAEMIIKPKDLTAGTVERYLSKHSSIFDKDPKAHLGGWWDKGNTNDVYFDVTTIVNTKKEAHDLAVKHKELAYFDLSSFETIRVGSPQDTWEEKMSYSEFKRLVRNDHIKRGLVKPTKNELDLQAKKANPRFVRFDFPRDVTPEEVVKAVKKLTEK